MPPNAPLPLSAPGVSFLLPYCADLQGILRGKLVPVSQFETLRTHGTGFGAAALQGMGLGPHTAELMAKIDPAAGSLLPWDSTIAAYPANLYFHDEAFSYDPRFILAQVVAQAKQRGYRFFIGVEPEHFLVTSGPEGLAPWDPEHVETKGKLAFNLRMTLDSRAYLTQVTSWLNQLGWDCYVAEKEEGPAQFEINFGFSDAQTTADRLLLFKLLAREAAKQVGALATFMAKPFPDRTGSGLHFHFHLENLAGQNQFVDTNQPLGVSKIGRHFMAGIFRHAAALCAVTNPTVNCYKRLATGGAAALTRSGYTWAPASITYGGNNRTVMIRVPAVGHLEDRSPSPNCNPYLAFAAYLAAGLAGIEEELDPGKAAVGNLYTAAPGTYPRLPQTLAEATAALKADSLIREALGPIAHELIRWQEEQWLTYHRQITPYEYSEFSQLF